MPTVYCVFWTGASSMPDLLIEARAVGRSYRRGGETINALRSATFGVHAGDRVALVGRSGSGKSTLLHLMAGLDIPSSGTIAWPALGAPETLLPEKISLVFQAPSLIEPMNVSENVALPLLLAKSAADIDAAVNAALAIFGLNDLARKLPEELSGGQMQRVAMARAIIGHASVILADEPTGQLDQATGQALLDGLLAHLRGSNTALVVATHDPSVAGRMDTIWRIERGVLDASTNPAEAR